MPATATCACGQVAVEAVGPPLASVICYCDDCQEAARQIRSLPHAAAVDDADGGTAYLAYRKDRVRYLKGATLLRPHKLRADSATSRLIATCCNSALLLTFDDGKFWVDLYRSRCAGDLPPVQMRICTKFKPAGRSSAPDVPEHPHYPLALMVKLIRARLAMVFGS